MTYYAEAKKTITVWKRDGIKACEAYFVISNELRIDATWDQVADLIVGYMIGQQSEMRIAA